MQLLHLAKTYGCFECADLHVLLFGCCMLRQHASREHHVGKVKNEPTSAHSSQHKGFVQNQNSDVFQICCEMVAFHAPY
jgi:hypothetical protein